MGPTESIDLPTKTLYTPVFYGTPSSSFSTTTSRRSKRGRKQAPSYLDTISRTHVAMAQIVKEAPPSRCGSPANADDGIVSGGIVGIHRDARVDALRRRVQDAFAVANGEPADGKWYMLGQLLQMGVTRGRYQWVGARTDGRTPTSVDGWLNAETETEWLEWERMREEADRVKQKVESWKKKLSVERGIPEEGGVEESETLEMVERISPVQQVDAAPITVPAKVKPKPTVKRATPHDPKDPSPLGFTVIKKSAIVLVGKPVAKETAQKVPPLGETPRQPQDTHTHDQANTKPPDNNTDPTEAPAKHIADLSEMPFLPPSFSSEIVTSTPNAKKEPSRQKPPPIPHIPHPSPLSAPPLTSQPPPEVIDLSIRETSPPSQPVAPDHENIHDKRRRSPSPPSGRATKKARILTDALDPPGSSGGNRPLPSNPAEPTMSSVDDICVQAAPISPHHGRETLPTLTDLLASRSTSLKSKMKKMRMSDASPLKTFAISTTSRPKPNSNSKSTTLNSVSQSNHNYDSHYFPRHPSLASQVQDSHLMSQYAPHIDELNIHMAAEPPGLDYRAHYRPSSTKSLSSLAGSDTDSDEERDEIEEDLGDKAGKPIVSHQNVDIGLDIEEFDPPFASTQALMGPGPPVYGLEKPPSGPGTLAPTSSGMWPEYDSRFDVDAHVERASKFMEQDVDYDGWLRDLTPEPEDS